VLFFLIIGYVTFFSAFMPSPPNSVCCRINTPSRFSSADCGKGFESRGGRHPLQVPCAVFITHLFLLRHRQLGGMAVLPELLKRNVQSAEQVGVNYWWYYYSNQNIATAIQNAAK
jgi:hypothetical protein